MIVSQPVARLKTAFAAATSTEWVFFRGHENPHLAIGDVAAGQSCALLVKKAQAVPRPAADARRLGMKSCRETAVRRPVRLQNRIDENR